MSKLIPQRTVDALRKQVNITLDNFGITCSLYIPTNLNETETMDIYQSPADYTFDHYTSTCYIDWRPNIWRLKSLGMFVEDQVPILAYFGSEATNDLGELVDVDVLRHSYITVTPQYIPDNFTGVDEFEVVDIGIPAMHDAVVLCVYKLVPRRYENVSG